MNLFDTHVHVDCLSADGADLPAVFERATQAGVGRILAIGGSPDADQAACEAARRYPIVAGVALGLNRDHVHRAGEGANPAREVMALEQAIRATEAEGIRVVAVGEIGIDLHYHPDSPALQAAWLEIQLELALKLGKPAVVHTREADRELLEVLRRHAGRPGQPAAGPGVVHSFTGDRSLAGVLLDFGWYISFSGILTFRNADLLRSVAADVPEDRLLIETDSPFLSPVPMRGKPNEPAFVAHVVDQLARIRNVTPEYMAEATSRNACRLFNVGSRGV